MNNQAVADNLKQVLANSYSLYLKTHNYHWNVTGPQFPGLHALFEAQYTDLFAAVDLVAERIRALGEKAPGSFRYYTENSKIRDGNENASANEMVKELADDNQSIVSVLYDALKVAETNEDEATLDLLVERIATHEKNAWMLKSSL